MNKETVKAYHKYKKQIYDVSVIDYLAQWCKMLKPKGEEFRKEFPYKKIVKKGYRRYFMDSMFEIAELPQKTMNELLTEISIYHQHTFQFLTKNPTVYDQYDFLRNCWLGWSITKDDDYFRFTNMCGPDFFMADCNKKNIKFVSFEPLKGPINENILFHFDWAIIGIESGNRLDGNKWPKEKYVTDILKKCARSGIPAYMKDNIKKAFPDMILWKEFPHKYGRRWENSK